MTTADTNPEGPLHREARALAFTSFLVNGVEINLTMREGATADLTKSLLLELGQVTKWLKTDLHAVPCLSRNAQDGLAAERARANGKKPNSPITPENGYEPTGEEEEPEGQAPAKAAGLRPARQPAPPANGKAAPVKVADPAPTRLTFQTDRLIGETKSGKTYWKLAGGKFAKFGVRVWPEVLASVGIDAESLDPDVEYEITMTATYEEKDGKPSRVTALE